MEKRGDPVLGAALKEARKRLKLSQAAAAAAASEHLSSRESVTRGHISAIETAARPPGRELLFALAKVYEMSLDTIASRAGLVGDREAKDDYEATWLFIAREMRGKGGEAVQEGLLKGIITPNLPVS